MPFWIKNRLALQVVAEVEVDLQRGENSADMTEETNAQQQTVNHYVAGRLQEESCYDRGISTTSFDYTIAAPLLGPVAMCVRLDCLTNFQL